MIVNLVEEAGKIGGPLKPDSWRNPMRRVALLLVNAAVTFKDGVDPRHARSKLLRSWPFTPPVAGRNRNLKHLHDRVPVNAKPLRRLPAAQPVHHHCASDLGIEFHCEHPSIPSMPFKDIETAQQNRYTFAPPSKRQITAGSVVHFASAIYMQ